MAIEEIERRLAAQARLTEFTSRPMILGDPQWRQEYDAAGEAVL